MSNKIWKPAFVDWWTFYSNFIKLSEAFKKQSGGGELFWSYIAYTNRPKTCYSSHKNPLFTGKQIIAYSVQSQRLVSSPLLGDLYSYGHKATSKTVVYKKHESQRNSTKFLYTTLWYSTGNS